ncbi:13051_t:CDS:2 [Ambispora gerdemannii]|uniref:13051_t:CDS:1 n=1 Tax=Ambispora gerdemannii TaxID=144530 RepID=A0A9N8YJV6_9GLOM|nr:13051_t:CDS:2 [Ambispora gerdemannii]
MTSPQHNLNSQELQPYGGDDVFDEFLDLDFLRNNNAMEEEVDIDAMSNSDLFRYFLEGELAKDSSNSAAATTAAATVVEIEQQTAATSFPTPMQDVTEDFALLPSPAMSPEDLKLNVLTTPTPLTPVSPFADIHEITQQTPTQQTITNTAAVAPSLAVLNAQLAELLAKLPLIKQESINDNNNKSITQNPPSSTSKSLTELQISKTGSNSHSGGSSIASPSSPPPTHNISNHHSSTLTETRSDVDLKKLTSKERRQLRNKISARNFRVRRKGDNYSFSTNQQQEEEINLLRQALAHLQDENTKLQGEVKELRKQQKRPSNTPFAASSPHLTSKDVNNGVNLALLNNNVSNNNRSSSSSSPSNNNRLLVIPNVNKDTPSSPSQSQQKWKDSRVRVQTTFIPEFSLDKQLFMDKSQNYSNYFGYHPSSTPSMTLDGEHEQMKWIAYLLFSTLAQQLSSLFIQALCTIPRNELIAGLFPHNNDSNNNNHVESSSTINTISEMEPDIIPSLTMIRNQDEEKFLISRIEQENDDIEASSSSSLLDNNLLVEDAKEASVLDWLYDTMVRHVVEQSQVEARMHELQSDWVGDELEDNVLPLLF